MARDLGARLGLRTAEQAGRAEPAPPLPGATARPLTEVVFRVSNGSFPVTTAMSIVGADAQLGSLVPNAVAMHDDGAGGDERARDGVWSLAATFAPGTRLSYVYTNSGARGRWEGLDVPHIRSIVVPFSVDGGPVYLPIETFGRGVHAG